MLFSKFQLEGMGVNSTRRQWLLGLSTVSAGTILLSCNRGATSKSTQSQDEDQEKGGPEVTATEDLMREHGVLRRVLLVYSETALKLRANPSVSIPAEPLQRAAKLFRAFGEEYHEKKLEEAYIFPAVKKVGGPAGGYADILTAQHQRGREITDYILSITATS